MKWKLHWKCTLSSIRFLSIRIVIVAILASGVAFAAKDTVRKPQTLKPGDTIGIVGPSSNMSVKKLAAAENSLPDAGYRVKICASARGARLLCRR